MVDVVETGEGPFSTERSGGISSTVLADFIFSGKYTEGQIRRMLRGQGGLYAHLGSASALEAEKRAEQGDPHAIMIYSAMAYQVSKWIGALATVMKGKVDRIVLTGGIARSKMLVDWIIERVNFIAPIEIFPGEFEIESMANGVYRVLTGAETAKEYIEREE